MERASSSIRDVGQSILSVYLQKGFMLLLLLLRDCSHGRENCDVKNQRESKALALYRRSVCAESKS